MAMSLDGSTIIRFKDFRDLLNQLVEEKLDAKFIAAYPTDEDFNNINEPIIAYRYLKRPYETEKGFKERKPRYRKILLSEEHNLPIEESLEVYGQKFEYEIDFEIYARNNFVMEELLEKFENLIFNYMPYFVRHGVEQLIFVQSSKEEKVEEPDLNLLKKTVTYQMILDSIVGVRRKDINKISFDINEDVDVFYIDLDNV